MTEISALGGASATTPKTGDRSILDKDGFLKMLVAQMQHQDPASPMSASEQTQQMASFTMVEQITNMTAANEQLAASMYVKQAIDLVGRTVTYTDENDESHTGVVESVATAGGNAKLTVDGVDGITPSVITKVA
ncbi:MAG TPA: flagellar hook capping FlgD N-terminal domain-containing protein [Solirubrobacter sp.]|nr:flagellar hook capping FlgD N-terminal domain-containing protein [Solirubrobacter sp.]